VSEPLPPEVVELAERRAAARAAKDFAASDALRNELSDAGWVVRDRPDGYDLEPRLPYAVARSGAELPDRSGSADTHPASVALVVDGWPDDARRCVASLLAHTPAEVSVLLLDNGAGPEVAAAVHELASATPDRVQELHVEDPLGWAAARTALLRADTATVHVWAEPSVELTGNAITPVVSAVLEDERVGAAGPYGVDVAADWQSFTDAVPGDVDALNGYLLAFRRSALLAVGGPHPKARYYRNADLELGFTLRADGWRVVMTEPVPLTLHRHRGYHDTDPAVRDRESRRNYDRFLDRFRP
jgi:hypothetical protein